MVRMHGEGNRIERMFAEARDKRRKLLMPFVCAGDPAGISLSSLLPRLERAGASIVEIGVPFSDPIADGPTIAAAMHRAIGGGMTPAGVIEQVRAARGATELGIVLMVSASVIFAHGVDRFAELSADAGVDGFIVPDAPLEEAGVFRDAMRSRGMTLSLLVSPTSPAERVAKICEASSGFVYLLARTGLTGEREGMPEIAEPVSKIREASRLPIACGFGISTAEQVEGVVEHADAAIVGSALVRRMAEAGSDPLQAAETYISELSAGLIRMDQV